jgi:hypothetical protein
MMRTVFTLVAVSALSSLALGAPSQPSPAAVVKVQVPVAAMDVLKTRSRWVFLTPATSPIRSVSDLNAPTQVAFFDSNITLIGDVLKFLEAAGASPAGVVDLGSDLQVFGPATEKDRVRLFVADGPTEAARVKGGVKVEFVADSASPRGKP